MISRKGLVGGCGEPDGFENLGCQHCFDELLKQMGAALQAAYMKHTCGDDSVGSHELDDMLCDALCEWMGDKEFSEWSEGLK